jgi:hypothetical protein
MRIEFPQGTPIDEQIRRRIKVATGRKHQGRPGPGKPKKGPRVAALKTGKARALKKRVRMYWAGELDEFPS